jgi:WD40 repeat protein/serine/threonine protein kinase
VSVDRAGLAKKLFHDVIELPSDDRERFLTQRCGGDAVLRADVDVLLGADANMTACFLQGVPDSSSVVGIPERIGSYQITRRIGEGGMGSIFEAVQDNPRRSVALKLLKVGTFSQEALRRFEYEAQVVARLVHPGIAQIYEAGTQAIGGVNVPYFAMELITDALPITEYVRAHGLDIRSRLTLFIEICDAIQYGHLRGVIHRDLKPANILVDSSGRPRVIDFGVARSISADAIAATMVTGTSQIIGTLSYMSPEQCGGRADEVDVRSDVYSLGIVLYELLCDRLPYEIVQTDILGAVRIIREQAPTRPSAVHRSLRGDLQTIVLKAIEKDRARRYQTVLDLARDIDHYLVNEPIEARRDSNFYVFRKTIRRHRAAFSALGAFVLLIAGAAIALSILYGKQSVLLGEVKRQRDRAVAADQLSQDRLRQQEYEAYVANIAAASAAIAANDGGLAFTRLQAAAPALRNWEWRYLIRQADQSIASWKGPKDLMPSRALLSGDGRFAGVSFRSESGRSELRIWDRSLSALQADTNADDALIFSAKESSLFVFLSDEQLMFCQPDGIILRWDLKQRRETGRSILASVLHGFHPWEISPGGRFILGQGDRTFWVWSTQAGEILQESKWSEIAWPSAHDFDLTGTRLAIGLSDGTARLFEMPNSPASSRVGAHDGSGNGGAFDQNGTLLGPACGESGSIVYGVAFHPNGSMLATACGETGSIKIWKLRNKTHRAATVAADPPRVSMELDREFQSGDQRNNQLAFSPDGHTLAVPSEDKSIRIWGVDDGMLMATLRGHSAGVSCISFSCDSRLLVSGGREAGIRLWDLQAPPPLRVLHPCPGGIGTVAFMRDGARLLLSGSSFLIVDINGETVRELPVALIDPRCNLPGPADSQITFADQDGSIRIWEIEQPREVRRFATHKSIAHIAGCVSAGVLASADAGAVCLWDWAKGRELHRFPGPGETVRCAAMGNDAARLALGLINGALLIMDTDSGQKLLVEHAHEDSISSVAFSPDGRRLATASGDGSVKLWNSSDGAPLWTASPQIGDVWCIAFSPDGTRLAAGGRDRSVRIFDALTGRDLLALRGPSGTVMCLAFSPDGLRLAAGSWARELFIWEAKPDALTR